MKWKRTRPGLYEIHAEHWYAIVERGGESQRWWWAVYHDARGWKCDFDFTARVAKIFAESEGER